MLASGQSRDHCARALVEPMFPCLKTVTRTRRVQRQPAGLEKPLRK
jgi:hypothetical protein